MRAGISPAQQAFAETAANAPGATIYHTTHLRLSSYTSGYEKFVIHNITDFADEKRIRGGDQFFKINKNCG
jgi:hypothetical protein